MEEQTLSELQKKQLKFLEETAKFYNLKNRGSREDHGCFYITSDGKKCAIGRHLSDEVCKKLGTGNVTSTEVWKELPEELKELEPQFLQHIQHFHDNKLNWNEEGLTDGGKRVFEAIKKRILTGDYKD